MMSLVIDADASDELDGYLERRLCKGVSNMVDIIGEYHFGWVGISCWVSRQCIRSSVLGSWDVNYLELISEGPLF